MQSATNSEINEVLNKIFDNSRSLLAFIAPNGWTHSGCVNFFHPTAKQQYEEDKLLAVRLNKITKNNTSIESINPDKYQQDDLSNISEIEEFQLVLGLTVYDIFSDNHEVYGRNNRVFDLGSFRGSGRFIADFLNNKYQCGKKYGYLDFYMGTIWIKERADLLPFYEYIFQILKNENLDWCYSFPRLHLLDMSVEDNYEAKDPANYNPEEEVTNELEKLNKKREVEEFQNELDLSYQQEYEDAKYRPLIPIIQAYKNIYKTLPKGHPQKEFE